MKTTESVNRVLEEFSIDEVLNSLRGPIIRSGKNPEVTSVVEYYHMLPFVNALTDYFTRKAPLAASSNLLLAHPQVSKECQFDSDVMPGHQNHGTYKLSDQTKRTIPISSEIAGLMTNETAERRKRDHSFGEDSSNEACGLQSKSNISSLDMGMQNEIESNKACAEGSTPLAKETLLVERDNKNKKKQNLSSEEDLARAACEAVSSQLALDRLPTKENRSRKCQSTVNEDENSKESAEVNSRATNREYLDLVADEASNKMENNSSSGKDSAKAAFRPEAHAVDSQMVVDAGPAAGYQAVIYSSKMTGNNSSKASFKIITSLPKKSNAMESKYGEHFGIRYINRTVQDAIGPSDSSLLAIKSQFEQYDCDLSITSKRDVLLRALLAVLQKRQHELSHQQRYFEDQIACCEINIQAILSDLKGSGKLSVDSVLEAINVSHSSQVSSQPKDTKVRRLSEAVLAMKDPCEEIFRLLTVKGVDFECSVHGDFKCNPSEARFYAASKMLSTLSSIAGQGKNK